MADSNISALTILRQAQNTSFDAQSRAEVAGIKSTIGAKMDGFKAAKDQAHADQASSIVKFAGSGAGLGLNYKTSTTAHDLMAKKGEAAARGVGMNTAAQNNNVGNMVDKAVDAVDQQIGAQAKSQAAKIAGKQAEAAETMAKSVQDSAKAGKDGAAKFADSIEEFAKGIFTRAQEVIAKAF